MDERLVPGDLNRRISAGLAKLALVLRHQAWSRGRPSGLTPTQGQVLALLDGQARGGLSMKRIAAELAVSQPTVSDAVAALERKGLVSRERSDADARVVRVSLTRKGARAAARQVEWPDAVGRTLHALDATEQESLLRILVKMIHALQVDGQIPVARMCPTCNYFRPNVHASADKPHHCAFVDAPLADADLRLDCADHEMLTPPERRRLWSLFVGEKPLAGGFPASSAMKGNEP
ncbi:MAG: MarR family winged helix-turn-helix transcriptional regulator [Phycisphaerae bacterium]|nr:winged helix-turn-helix transcriptional regulator [Phycisphaerae bacterium]MCZ2400385.1 MarR family winged helix-turn-helix transcriptional regulator [Phycisphaerae bacterium]